MNVQASAAPVKLLATEAKQTLAQLQHAVEMYLQTPEDPAPLQTVLSSTDLLRGVFTIIGKTQAADLMTELQALSEALLTGQLLGSERIHEALLQTALQTSRYWQWLQLPASPTTPPVAFDLQPLLQQLQGARGIAANQSVMPSSASQTPQQLANTLRPILQRSMLNIIRGRAQGLEQLKTVFQQLKEQADKESDYRIWWLAEYLANSLQQGQLTIDKNITLLLRDLDHLIKQSISTGTIDNHTRQITAQRLAQQLSTVEPSLAMLDFSQHSDYQPPITAAETASSTALYQSCLLDQDTLAVLGKLLQESIAQSQDIVDRFANDGSGKNNLADSAKQLHETANILKLLNISVPAELLHEHATKLVKWQQANATTLPADAALQVASELLLVQNSLTDIETFYYSQALTATVASHLDAKGKTNLLMQYEIKRARLMVARETAQLIKHARTLVNNAVDPAHDNSVWPAIQPLLQQSSSILVMLDCQRAQALLQNLHASLQLLIAGTTPHNRNDFLQELANLIVAFEHYLTLFTDYEQHADLILAEAEQHHVTLRALLDHHSETIAPSSVGIDTESLAELTLTHSTIAGESATEKFSFVPSEPVQSASADPIVDSAKDEEAIVDNSSSKVIDLNLATTIPQDSVSVSATKTPTAMDNNEQDLELLEIFFEEAEGEVVNIGELLPQWRDNPVDQEHLKSIRRSFHTLKGSGRMVGETVIGELAWHYEQLLNRILDGQLKPLPIIIDSVDQVRLWLAKVVSANSAHGQEAAAEELSQHALAILNGDIKVATATPAADVIELNSAITEDINEDNASDTDEIAIDDLTTLALPNEETTPDTAIETELLESLTPVASSEFTNIPAQPAFMSALPPEADPELAEVFIYEAADILDASEFTLQQWQADSENHALINDLRREMHTLKGGSRLSGLTVMGDLSHAVEAVLEAVPKGEINASPAVLEAVQRTLDSLSTMLSRLREGISLQQDEDLISDLYGLLGANDTEAVRSLRQASQTQDADSDAAEFREVFMNEAAEMIESGTTMLNRWQAQHNDQQAMGELRRALHTLKGSSRLAGFGPIGDLAQATLELVDTYKSHGIEPNEKHLQLLQNALQQSDVMLQQVKTNAELIPASELIATLQQQLSAIAPANIATLPQQTDKAAKRAAKRAASSAESIRVDASLMNNLINQMGESSIYRARVEQGVNGLRFNLDEMEQTLTRLRQQMRRLEIETEAQIMFRHENRPKDHAADFDPLEFDRFSELQQLSRSMMEIVEDLANVQRSIEDQSQNMGFLLDQQGKVNKEIQQGLMRTSMVRFSTVVPRLRRVVRQAAQEVGKRAQLVVHGDESEVDRTVLDNMVAPLEHMLRNALTHGIETPAERSAAGKPESGTITMSLRREGAELVLQLEDDGGGINYEAIKAKGISKGLLQDSQQASEQDLIALLFQPGFSTASQVTQLAGRGVGLDVLNEAIKAMRGALQIQSQPKQGTTFTIRLPFSLAVTQALLVKIAEQTYAIPMLSLEAVDRLSELEMNSYLAGDPVKHHYGSNQYPLHSLSILFGHQPLANEQNADAKPAALLFRSAEASAALHVDEVLGNQEIIVKPVGPQLHNVPGVSGATVLGDGRVVIVLELAALVRRITSQSQQQITAQVLESARHDTEVEQMTAMVIDDSITMRKVTARFLSRHEINVKTAKDGVEAVAMFEELAPDLIIVDIEMPRMDGFEVVAHVRNQERLKHIPVIMVTSRSGEKHRNRAAKLGVDDYLIKPYQEEELMNSIQQVLSSRGLALPS